MSELRKDPVINRWVITLDDKTFTPHPDSEFINGLSENEPACPFCPGNEDKTPHTITEKKDSSGAWSIRVIPNNNPYLKVETPLQRKSIGIFDYVTGMGANEVIIETPKHNLDIDTMPLNAVADVIKTYADRINDLKNDTRLEYVLIFKNRGKRAGGHIEHAHSQLMALPVIPKKVQEEVDSAEAYFKLKKHCVYCDLVANEIQMKDRVVVENASFLCVTPFASRLPFEMWIIPKRHDSHFGNINNDEIQGLSEILKDSLRRMNKALSFPAYNYIIHTSPQKAGSLEHYHWHVEIVPRIKSLAGFEWGSGFYINPTLPEETAGYLRSL